MSSSWQTTSPPDCVSLDRPPGGDDRINCLGASHAAPVVCISEVPLSPRFPYLEITLLEGAGSAVILGLMREFHDHDGGGIPGKRLNSIGFFSNGDLLCNVPGSECSLPFSSPFGQLDTIGIGIENSTSAVNSPMVRAFATHNGRDLGTILTTEAAVFPYYPVIAFEESQVMVTVRKKAPFLFDRTRSSSNNSTASAILARTASSEQWQNAVKSAGMKLSRFFSPVSSSSSLAESQTLEADLLETQEHINLLAGVLREQKDQYDQRELLLDLSVSCRRLLVRHQNLIREATDDTSLQRILQMNDDIVELLASADRILETTTSANGGGYISQPLKLVSPSNGNTSASQGWRDSLMEKGTSSKVTEMLHMLRSGTPRAQKNAATSLAVFCKEELCRDLVVINGGVHCLVVMANKEDAELAALATLALAELASRIRMRKEHEEAETNFWVVRSMFKSELPGVLKALSVWAWSESGDLLLAAQAVSNLILLSVITKAMEEIGADILLRILQDSSSLDACRIAAFGVSLLIRKSPASKASLVSQYLFFRILETLLSEDQDEELLLYGVSCLAALLMESRNREEDRFAQGFITARVLHSKHRVLQNLILLCNASEAEERVRSYLVQSFHAIILHPSGLAALLDQVSGQELVNTLLVLVSKLLPAASNARLPRRSSLGWSMESAVPSGSSTTSVVMDESSYFYSARFQDTLNVNDKRTRLQMMETSFSELPALATALRQVLAILPSGAIHLDFAQVQIIDELCRDAASDAAEVIALLCIKFGTGENPVLIKSTLFHLLRVSASTAAGAMQQEQQRKHVLETIVCLCEDQVLAEQLYVYDYATHLCALQQQQQQPREVTALITAALLGLAKVCFFEPGEDELFGFEPDGPVLSLLLHGVQGFEADPALAAGACRVLALAVSGRGALSAHYRSVVLKQIGLDVSQMSSRCLMDEGRRAAEELLQVCGFSFGAFQVVANETLAIQEWASLKADLELYQVVLDHALFKQMGRPRQDALHALLNGFYDQAVNAGPHQALRVKRARKSELKAVATNVVLDLKQSPPSKWMQVMAANLGHAQTLSREVLDGEIKIAKRLFRGLVSANGGEMHILDLYLACLDLFDLLSHDSAAMLGDNPAAFVDTLPRSIQLLFDTVYENVGPLELYLQLYSPPSIFLSQQQNPFRAKRMRLLRLRQPVHVWTQALVSTIVAEEEGEDARFALVCQSADLLAGADEKTQMVELLHANSALTSLILVGNGSAADASSREGEERIAQLVGNLPSSLVWLTLDRNAMSAEGLRLLAAFLGVRCTLQGLAITNSAYGVDDLADLIRVVGKNSGIQCLDLSNNTSLSDANLARLCKQLVFNSKLIALNLSGNRVGHATMDALLGGGSGGGGPSTLSPDALQRDIRGEARIAPDGLLQKLEYLSLAKSWLSSDCAARLLYALSKGAAVNCVLKVLDLDGNGLVTSKLQRALVSFLAFNRTVCEFGYAENSDAGSAQELKDLLDAMRGNAVIQYFRHAFTGNLDQFKSVLKTNRDAAAAAMLRDELEQRRDSTVSEEEEEESAVQQQQHRLQVLFASPLVFRTHTGELKPMDALDGDSERQLLLNSFEEARALSSSTNSRIGVHFEYGCTTERLISVLTRKPTSLHLSTHGEEDYIILEDGRGGAHALLISQLKEICAIARVDKFLKLVVVSACSSSAFVAQAFVDAGVRNVVGVNSSITDRAAQVFTRAFYLSLALGDEIGLAFQIARQAVRASPAFHLLPGEENKFVLLGDGSDSVFPKPVLRGSASAAGGVIMRRLVPNQVADAVFPSPSKWRLAQSKFLEVIVPGRRIDAYLALVALTCKRVVIVVAPEGYGKTATLSGFLCKYLNDRVVFKDGAVALDLFTCRNMRDVYDKLNRFVRKPSISTLGSGNSLDGGGSSGIGLNDNEELERTMHELAKRKCLLLLDHVDYVLDECFEEFRFFLGHLLDRTKIRLLLTTRHKENLAVPGHEHLMHVLGPLDGLDSALLFLRNCPHYYNDMHRRDATPPKNFEYGLARHPFIYNMRGVPKTIVTAASVLTYAEWEDLVEEVVDALLPSIHLDNT